MTKSIPVEPLTADAFAHFGDILSADGARVGRKLPLPDAKVSDARTVYVEPLPAGCTMERLRARFDPCGKVCGVFIPRVGRAPSGRCV